ncbi:hypothetical protein JCM30566_09380 [Marinitoga arctica]
MKKSLMLFFLLFFIYGFSNITWEIKPSKYEIIQYSKQIKLYWNLNEKVDSYNVFLGEKETNLELVYKGNKNQYIVTNLQPNKKYYWKIIAKSTKKTLDSGIREFYLKLEKPKITTIHPYSQYNIDSENIEFFWNIQYPVNYTTNLILYKNDEKILEKQVLNGKYSINLLPGTKYKWYLNIKDEFNNKYLLGPYYFSTKPYELLMHVDKSIFNIKVYGSYLEKNQIYKSDHKINNIQKYGNFLFLSFDSMIEIIHKNGKKVSEINIDEIKDFDIDKIGNEILLYAVNNKSLMIFDVTNPFYPFLKKQIFGNYISISSNKSNILLLKENEINIMNKNLEIYYKKDFKQLRKIMYNDDNGGIILSNNKLIKFRYKNNTFEITKELELFKIIDFVIDNGRIALLTFNMKFMFMILPLICYTINILEQI